jgi:site-specific recombinase XerD
MLKFRREIQRRDLIMAQLELCKLAQHYAHSNAAEGKSPATIQGYNYNLSLYIRHLVKTGTPAMLSALTLELARDFVLQEQSRGMSPFSVQDEVRALKAFASWLDREDYTTENVLAKLILPKAPQRLTEILTAAEIDLLIKYQNPLTQFGSRNIAILATLVDSGIRLSEMCALDLPYVHLEDGYF